MYCLIEQENLRVRPVQVLRVLPVQVLRVLPVQVQRVVIRMSQDGCITAPLLSPNAGHQIL